MRIVWLPRAHGDLFEIESYYLRVADRAVANRVLQQIVRIALRLETMPYLGRPSQSTDGVHELKIVKLPYILPYRVIEDRVEILRVFHESRERPEEW